MTDTSSIIMERFDDRTERQAYIERVFSSVQLPLEDETSTFDLNIRVDDEVFRGHSFLVLHHSRRLGQRISDGELVLPSDIVSKEAFAEIHRWMYGLEVSPSSKDLLERIESAARELDLVGNCVHVIIT